MIISIVIFLLLIGGGFLFLRTPKFGRLASGSRRQHILQSPNYKDGKFQNYSFTPNLTEGVSYFEVLKGFFFGGSKRGTPAKALPSSKTNLHALRRDEDVLIWFGHSSYFLQLDGKRILVDPVLSGSASPIKFTTRSFKGSDIYTVEDLPEIDYLFISHDHWDHLDHETMVSVQPKIGKVVTGLGVGAHLEYWGYAVSKIIEKDWNEEIVLDPGFIVTTVPARHFSGRGLRPTQSIWSSFVFETPNWNIFIGGDSGYDTHFETVGKKFGPFHLAILECGQYDLFWRYIHMLPEEVVQAAIDLNAMKLLPVHWAKFKLGNHAWDEPIQRVTAEAAKLGLPVLHPMIGEKVDLKNPTPGVLWWESVE